MIGKKYEFEEISGKIIGAGIEVHKTLGPGFIESIYHNSMKKELDIQKIPYETEKDVKIYYKDEQVGEHRLDLYVNNEIVVELKAIQEIIDVHISQVVSYLKASNRSVGIILNFGKSKLDIKRVKY